MGEDDRMEVKPQEPEEARSQGIRRVIHVDIEAVKKDDEDRRWGETHEGKRPALLMTANSGGESNANSSHESQGRDSDGLEWP